MTTTTAYYRTIAMNRSTILSTYRVENNIICSPGKFAGNPIYAPYFWEMVLEGAGEDIDGDYFIELCSEDRAMFPELGEATNIVIWEDDQGFICCEAGNGTVPC